MQFLGSNLERWTVLAQHGMVRDSRVSMVSRVRVIVRDRVSVSILT